MISNYNQSCGYNVGSLKDFIYLIPYSVDRFSYSIDNGQCSEVGMNENSGVIRIDGFNATLKNTETEEERFKYESEVDIYIHETLGQNFFDRMKYLIQNKWFVVVEDLRGVQYIQSVEFYSEFSYNLSLTEQNNAQNRIQLVFKGSSNFPTMIMGKNISKGNSTALIKDTCRYINGGVKELKMCEHSYVYLKESNHEVSSINVTGGYSFKDIEFIPKSFTYTQAYSGGQFEDTLTFSIPLSDYKFYWHYNLIEFKNNRYVATFRTANDNMYVIGYSDGASVSYVIETSTALTSLNKITITLKYIGSEGFFISSHDDSIFKTDDSYKWQPAPNTVNGMLTKECQSNGQAYIILIQKYTSNGTAMNEYMVLEGYADRFPTLNITGTYTLDDDLGFPLVVDYAACTSGQCKTNSGITNPYTLSSLHTTETFTFSTECDYTITDVPSWLTVSPSGNGYEMKLNDELPTENQNATFYIKTADGVKYPVIVNFTASGDTTGWDVYPREINIDHNAQNVKVTYTGNATADTISVSSDTLTLINKNDGTIVVYANANNTTNVLNHTFKVTNSATGESVEVKVNQSGVNEDWREVSNSYYCENGNKYVRLELYINGTATGTYKAGDLIEEKSEDCESTETRWVQDGTTCDGTDEYALMKEQTTEDGGTTWTDTGVTRKGDFIEANSEKCNPDHVKYKDTGEHICDNGKYCEVWAKYVDDVATGDTKNMNCVVDTEKCPVDYPTKWELSTQTQCVDRGNGICDSYYLNEQFITYDNGTTWVSLGYFEVSDTIAVKDDESCNCPNHDEWKYTRWVWDNTGFLCDDSSYDCKVAALWIPYGFVIRTYSGTTQGYWNTYKTMTSLEAPCDFTTAFNDATEFAKNCSLLETVETLDFTNIDDATDAFYNCTSLTTMPFKNTKSLTCTNRTFYNCSKLTGHYKIPMLKLINMHMMFYGSGINSWDFGGARLRYAPVEPITNSEVTAIYGLDYTDVETTDWTLDGTAKYGYNYSAWRSEKLVTLEIKNIGCDFNFTYSPNLSKESIQYMYENAKSDVAMTWKYSSRNKQKWGSLPTGKSNITFKQTN